LGEKTNDPVGFAVHGNVKVCYNCDAGVMAQNMVASGKCDLHLSVDMTFGWQVTNWPKTLRFQALGRNLSDQMQERCFEVRGATVNRQLVSFIGPDKCLWQGQGMNLTMKGSDKVHCTRVSSTPVKTENRHPMAKEFKMFVPDTRYYDVR
jgi:hypothetical protein